MPLGLGDMETEGESEVVCVIVSDAEPKDAEADPLRLNTLGVVETVAVCVLTVCVAS
jgi:hypothetical protein